MRFAFKTSPQDTTWSDMLAVWKAADDIDLFESGWTFDHFYPIFSDSCSALHGRLDHAGHPRSGDKPPADGNVGDWHPLSQYPAILANMAAHPRHCVRGRLDLGMGQDGTEESGAYGIELGTPSRARRSLEEACEVIVGLAYSGDDDIHRPLPPGHPRPVTSPGQIQRPRPADLHP